MIRQLLVLSRDFGGITTQRKGWHRSVTFVGAAYEGSSGTKTHLWKDKEKQEVLAVEHQQLLR